MTKKHKRNPWYIIFVFFLIIAISLLGIQGLIELSYWQGRHAYNELSKFTPFDITDNNRQSFDDEVLDWDALRAINPDIVAWILIPHTEINYPVVQGSDNAYYLRHDFYGSEGWLAQYGTCFLDCTNCVDFSDEASFIYGHNMNDGSMFSVLTTLTDSERFNECRVVYLFTPEKNYQYKTFSIIHCAFDDPLVQPSFVDPEQRYAYVQDKVDRSEVVLDDVFDLVAITHVLALSTCDNLETNGRYVLFCSLEDQFMNPAINSLPTFEHVDDIAYNFTERK